MFKFFREYNKYILVGGVTLLMVAFLIQPTLQMFQPDPGGEAIGTIGEASVTLEDRQLASRQLRVLRDVSPVLVQLGGTDPMQWLLMEREAASMGLSASQAQVDQLLADITALHAKISDLAAPNLARIADQAGFTIAGVRGVLHDWLVIQRYRELVRGLGHVAPAQMFDYYFRAGQYMQIGYLQATLLAYESLKGETRISEPLRRRFVHDEQSKVKVSLVKVDSSRYLDQVQDPDPARLAEMFEQYKEVLPGRGEPYGFGYRFPPRVKLAYLAIRPDRVRSVVKVGEAEALSYYDAHPEEFPQSPPPAADPEDGEASRQPVQPYEQVRNRIIRRLTDEQTAELTDRVIKTAHALLLDDARGLAEAGGYRVLPDDWQPVSLTEVAQQIQQQLGVLPDVRRIDDRWLTPEDLGKLDGIGSSVLTRLRALPFAQYVLSTDELQPRGKANALRSLRLQKGLASLPLSSGDGGRYVFRVIDARPGRVPESLDEVRDRVDDDARRLAAYERLKADESTWLERVRGEGVERLATDLATQVLDPAPFPRQLPLSGAMRTPEVEGVGRSEPLVQAVFDLAEGLIASGGVQEADEPRRVGAVAVDAGFSLVLFRVDKFEPITASVYQRSARLPGVSVWISQSLMGDRVDPSFTVETLAERVGYQPAEREEPDRDGDRGDDASAAERTSGE